MTALGFRPTTIETPARPLASEALLVSGCLIAFGAFLFSPYVLTDGDTLWHIATGQWMLQHLRVPHADPFSIPHFGQRWVAHEWLSELLMGGGYRLLGWTGVLLVYGAAYSLAVGAVIQHVGRYLGARGVAFVLLLLVLSSLR